MTPTHLSAHSHYSLLNGLPKVDELVARARSYGMEALALTDHNNLYGALEFYKACKEEGIKPLVGVDMDCSVSGTPGRLILLALSERGYRALISLVSSAHLAHPNEAPRLDLDTHASPVDDVVALIPEETLQNSGELFVKSARAYFGDEHVYARLGWTTSREARSAFATRARALSLPLIAGDDTYYLAPEDAPARDVVRRIADPSTPRDEGDRTFIEPSLFETHYRDFPEALENMNALVARATVELKLGSWLFPRFPIPEGTTYEGELARLAKEGFEAKQLPHTKAIEDRLEYELSIINGKGFAPYFLAVADLLKFARENGVLTTTRGSAAGSLVSYVTGITTINPIEYELPFERFLNPERPKAPDIDMDFADVHRDRMLAYAKTRYGSDHVAQIGTFGTMMARAAVRDVARALGYSYGIGDRIAKLIPFGSQGFPMTIEKALEMEEELRSLYQSDEDAEIIINTAKRVEGNARHISIHAAGIVIAPSPVTDYVPVQYDPHGNAIITQYNMHAVEDAGLLKFDFLGLTVLSILGDAVTRVKKRKNIDIDIENIPLDDPHVFAMLGRGETEGLFQLGGGGMTRYLKDLEPTSIHDINAMVALYRPGPMESIPAYIARKRNPALIHYLDPRMEKILDRSYGIVTYQDDVLLLAVELAGYTWLEADNLRKAMGKKIPAEMEAQKEKFISGCIQKGGITHANAQSLWRLIEPFAAYGFNKAHAASYGKVAYQTAYMKAHHAADYMASVMSADAGAVDKISIHVAECARLGIKVLPPSVSESDWTFTVVDDKKIRFGLDSIKNFGEASARAIILERARGPFTSVGDFASRIPSGVLNKRGLEALIKAGALDVFGDRTDMLAHGEEILAALSPKKTTEENQGALFSMEHRAPTIAISANDTTPLTEKLEWEKELLGIYVSGHPVDPCQEALAPYPHSILNAREEDRNGFSIILGGAIEQVKTILTKKGERMAFITIADREASIEAVAFPKVFQEARDALKVGSCILVKGKVSRRNDEPSVLIDKVKKIN
ncbi:MAG: DNA polymerase III subunit alpha [Patescibacteria group bacterium]